MKRFIPFVALLAVAAMVGCSGDSPSAKPVPTVVPVSWTVSSLTVSDTDVPLGTPILVDVTVTQNGSPAPDGTTVEMLSAGPAGAENFGFSAAPSKDATKLQKNSSVVTEGGRATVVFLADYVDPSATEHTDTPVGQYDIQARVKDSIKHVSVSYRASTVSGALQIFSIDPNRGAYAGGQQVVLSGKGIVAPVEVTFILNGVPFPAQVTSVLESIPESAPGSIVAITPKFTGTDTSIEQSADVRVVARVGAIGGEETDTLFQAYDLLPGLGTIIFGLAPNSGRSSGGEVVNILGQGFGSNASEISVSFIDNAGVVHIGQVLAVSPDGTQIQVETPRFSTLPLETDEPQDVSVTTPGGEARIQDGFLVLADAPQPTITGISPTSGPIDGGTLVTIFGNGFQVPIQVKFGNLTALDVNVFNDTSTADNDRITCVTPDYSQQEEVPPVTVDATVTNLTTGKTDTLGAAYTYGDILFISGNTPSEGGLGDLVVIFGSGFEDPLQVFLGDQQMEVVSVSGTELVVRIPDDLGTSCSPTSGTFKVVLLESNRETEGGNFTIRGNNPTVLSVSPIIIAEADLGTPNADITITGQAFSDEVLVTVASYVMPTSQVDRVSTTTIDVEDLPDIATLGVIFSTTQCILPGGEPGEQSSATSVPVSVSNFPGNCTDTLAGAIVIEPTASVCTATPANIVTNPATSWSFPNTVAPAPPCSPPQVLTITNTGGEDATGLNFTLPLASFNYVTDDCPANLAFNQSCSLTMEFCPASAGAKIDQLQINYTSILEGAKAEVVSLTGNGI